MDIRWSVQIGRIEFDLEFPNHAIITPKDKKYAPFRVSRNYLEEQLPKAGGYYVRRGDNEELYFDKLIK